MAKQLSHIRKLNVERITNVRDKGIKKGLIKIFLKIHDSLKNSNYMVPNYILKMKEVLIKLDSYALSLPVFHDRIVLFI